MRHYPVTSDPKNIKVDYKGNDSGKWGSFCGDIIYSDSKLHSFSVF